MMSTYRLFAALLLSALPAVLTATEPEQKKLTATACYERVLSDIQSRSLVRLPANWQTFHDVKPKDFKELEKALDAALAAANHPQLKLLTAKEASDATADRDGGYAGIGCKVGVDSILTGGMRVKEVLPDSYGEEAGVRVNDIIVAADGQVFDGWSFHRVVHNLMKGEPGSKVTLALIRNGKSEVIAVERDVERSLGLLVEPARNFKAFVITDVQADAPAQKAGVQEGDILQAVDGVSAGDIALNEAPANAIRNGALGTKVKLDLLRGDTTMKVEVVRSSVPNGDRRVMTALQHGGDGGGWWQVRAKNFDWKDLVAQLDDGIKQHGDLPLVLDLRGASGNDLTVAAQLLARLNKFNNPTIHAEVQSATGRKLEGFCGGVPPRRFEGKLTVLVDGTTNGTPEIIPWILQEYKRAEVRGQRTAGRAYLTSINGYELQDGKTVYLAIPDKMITYMDKPMPATNPDVWEEDVSQKANFQDAASKKARGDDGSDYQTVAGYAFLAVLVLIVVVLIVAAMGKSRVYVGEPSLRQPGPTDLSTGAAAPSYTAWIPVVLVVLVAIAAAVFLWTQRTKAPERGEVVVTVYVDGSATSKAQEKVAKQLELEYSGTIRFQVVPAAGAKDVTFAPAVRVSTFWYDKEGKVVATGWNQGGVRTKLDLVRDLERLVATEEHNGRSGLVLKRAWKVKP